MSIGVGVLAGFVEETDDAVRYKYGCFNWNVKGELGNPNYEMDGEIFINKECFPILEFLHRSSEKAEAKKGPIKKVIEREYTYEEMLEKGLVEIKNSRYAWEFDENTGYDVYAYAVLSHILSGEYTKNAEYPKKISLCK